MILHHQKDHKNALGFHQQKGLVKLPLDTDFLQTSVSKSGQKAESWTIAIRMSQVRFRAQVYSDKEVRQALTASDCTICPLHQSYKNK